MRIKFWGTRGSLPSPPSPSETEARVRKLIQWFFERGFSKSDEIEAFLTSLQPHEFGGYGGNTPCVEVQSKSTQIVIDGGSGIRRFGYQLMNGPCAKGTGEVHIFFTHFHWDHLIGLPFFTPIFIPGNKIHLYAVQPELEEVMRTVFRKPYFPVPYDQLGGQFIYHRLEPRTPYKMGDLSVTPYQLDHPDPCWGYRIVAQENGEEKVYSHCVDTECKRVTREQLGADLPLYQGVDVMLFDAQYTLMETLEKVDWGHAAATLGIDLALRESIKKIFFMHYDPAASDDRIAEGMLQAKRYFDSQVRQTKRNGNVVPDVKWDFALEGTALEI